MLLRLRLQRVEPNQAMSVTEKDTLSVYSGHRVLAMFPFFNEESKLAQMAERLRDGIVDKFIGVNDGSTDDGPNILRRRGIEVIDQPHEGAGACIKRAVKYAPGQWVRYFSRHGR